MGSSRVFSLSDKLLDFVSSEVADGISAIGGGIAAVMLLAVSLYFLGSMLQGTKFQLKMGVPVLLFILICNFTWVSKPATSFISRLSGTLVEEIGSKKQVIFNEGLGGNYECADAYQYFAIRKHTQSFAARITGAVFGSSNIFIRAFDKLKARFIQQLRNPELDDGSLGDGGEETDGSGADSEPIDIGLSKYDMSLMGLIALILNFVCNVVGVCVQCMGICLIAIHVALGPVVWAFSVFPGRAGNVISWFVRLCQYSLYAPLCALVNVFCVKMLVLIDTETGLLTMLVLVALLVCNIILLTSIPTLASMIIEGAQGSVSLSQGLQTMASTVSLMTTILMGNGAGVAMSLGKTVSSASSGAEAAAGGGAPSLPSGGGASGAAGSAL